MAQGRVALGKDSTAALQLVWLALRDLPADQRQKPVHVISTDTLVEQPLVAAWVDASLERLRVVAGEQGMPFTPHKLTPEVEDSFWVNLIGRGYPAPRQKCRWCTKRLKIRPSNKFIREMVWQYGEAILVLGTRKAESQARAGRMLKLEASRFSERSPENKGLADYHGSKIHLPSNRALWPNPIHVPWHRKHRYQGE